MKMLYINLVPITVGGGLQNTINFLKNFNTKELTSIKFVIILKDNKNLINICKERNFDYYIIKNTFISRLKYETLFFINKKNSIVFTLFGTKPILTWNNFTITGCAYSNLFYPCIDFWGYLSPIKKTIKQLKDKYRFLNVKASDVVIFETELLMKKAISDFGFNQNNTYTVKMAVSSDVNQETNQELDIDINSKNYNILYLGSSHPNKRQHLIPKIILEIKKRNIHNLKFIVTMNKNDNYTKNVFDEINKYNLNDYIQNLEYIENNYVANLIGKCDAMINIAALESFSNNFVEAWQMKKPLLVTNDDWAKGSCGNAAYYLNTEDISKVASQIEDFKKCNFFIAGDGPDKNKYEEFIKRNNYNNINLMGNIDRNILLSYYKSCDVFVLPSFSDPNPLSVIEALFASKPMLLSNQCGNNYEAIDENSNGYVFNPYDTNDIKKKFNIMIENRKDFNSMGKKSFEIANSKFHPRKIVSSFLEEI